MDSDTTTDVGRRVVRIILGIGLAGFGAFLAVLAVIDGSSWLVLVGVALLLLGIGTALGKRWASILLIVLGILELIGGISAYIAKPSAAYLGILLLWALVALGYWYARPSFESG